MKVVYFLLYLKRDVKGRWLLVTDTRAGPSCYVKNDWLRVTFYLCVAFIGSIILIYRPPMFPSAQTEAEVLEALDCLRDQPWPLDRRRETKKTLKAKLVRKCGMVCVS